MTVNFGLYPAGREVYFVRATIADVKWLMSEYPDYWQTIVGESLISNPERLELKFRKVFEGYSDPRDWLHLLQPQNVDPRLLFVDIDRPGWIALITDSAIDPYIEGFTRGLHCAVAERDSFPPVDEVNGVAQIRVTYQLREPSLDFGGPRYGDYLQVELASTSCDSSWVPNDTYVSGRPWYQYYIQATGLPGYEGFDLPQVAGIPEYARSGYPSYLWDFTTETFSLGKQLENLQKNPEASADFLKVLPFDHRGQERVVDFFNTRLVSQWLESTYGIRWNDPSFYEGESLLYIVGGPDAIKDPFSPRIPLEDYYRFQAIDLERNRKLIESGKF